ncbi:MAG: hypothetical protein ACOYK8_08195 [Alphaproteobacteria bacterium]
MSIGKAVEECLKAAKGNPVLAQQFLMQRCMQDATLLKALTTPFLKGITAHAVRHFMQANQRVKTTGGLDQSRMDALINKMADNFSPEDSAIHRQTEKRLNSSKNATAIDDLMQEALGLSKPFPQSTASRQASQNHAKNIRSIAAAFSQKRFEEFVEKKRPPPKS